MSDEEKEARERIGKLYYEANENCIKYEKIIEKQQKEIEDLKEKIKRLEYDKKFYQGVIDEIKESRRDNNE